MTFFSSCWHAVNTEENIEEFQTDNDETGNFVPFIILQKRKPSHEKFNCRQNRRLPRKKCQKKINGLCKRFCKWENNFSYGIQIAYLYMKNTSHFVPILEKLFSLRSRTDVLSLCTTVLPWCQYYFVVIIQTWNFT